jgi:hypothetical protein
MSNVRRISGDDLLTFLSEAAARSGIRCRIVERQLHALHPPLQGIRGRWRQTHRSQVATLLNGGYTGPFSYEPFSQEVQNLSAATLQTDLQKSIEYLFS